MGDFYLIDNNFYPPLEIERGSFKDCEQTLESFNQEAGFDRYEIISAERFNNLENKFGENL